jgi:hypothetical protein
MENLDLNKYQLAWKGEKSFHTEQLSAIEIHKFMKSASKIVDHYKKALLFDIVFKGILLISFLVLMMLLKNQPIAVLSSICFSFMAALGIIWQARVYKNIDNRILADEPVESALNASVDFYHGPYIKSIFVSALSSTLFFLSGSLFYLYYKYGQIPAVEADDIIVLTLGIILSYGISAYAQNIQNDFQITQLETCLAEIRENTITPLSIERYKASRIKNMVKVGMALVIGVIILLYLILGLNS